MVISAEQWQSKLKSLDRYRWALLRERYGFIGSVLRYVKDYLVDVFLSLRAKCRLSLEVDCESCEFLLLQSAPKVISFQRKKLLMAGLRSRGYSLIETSLQSSRYILRERLLVKPSANVPLRYFIYAAYAEWVVCRYSPKVLINDRNGSIYAPFLRFALNQRCSHLVQLAHATTVECSQRLSMNDYDYYFLFGPSSLVSLQRRKILFGKSRVLLSGSHMIDQSYDLRPCLDSNKSLLILGVGPDKEKEILYKKNYALLREWAMANPQYKVYIKAHPRSNVSFWKDAEAMCNNIEVLPSSCTLANALSRVSIVINIMSNAVVEAALARRVIIYFNASPVVDVLSQEMFVGSRVSSVEELSMRIYAINEDFSSYLTMSKQLLSHHLSHAFNGLENTIELLVDILNGSAADKGVSLDGNIF